MSGAGADSSFQESRSWGGVVVAWLLVAVPLVWGVWQTIKKAAALFR
jgi:hypothetical protein